MMQANQTLLTRALAENNLNLTCAAQEKLLHYLALILQWNRVYNLTTITAPAEMIYLHLIDSLVVAQHLTGKRILDVGSGAGLPGIPLAIMQPQQQFILLDKNSKKTRFLVQVIAELGLQNVEMMHARVQDLVLPECCDNILSRAFSSLVLFVTQTAHLLCRNGMFIAMKGKLPQEEIQMLPKNFVVQKVIALDIKGITIVRNLVCIKSIHDK